MDSTTRSAQITLLQLSLIIGLGILLGALTNALRATPLPWLQPQRMSTHPAESALKRGAGLRESPLTMEQIVAHLEGQTAVFVDARKREAFEQGRLFCAYHLPANGMQAALLSLYPLFEQDLPIVIYCEGVDCQASHDVCEFLIRSGIPAEKIHIFEPGWKELQRLEAYIATGP